MRGCKQALRKRQGWILRRTVLEIGQCMLPLLVSMTVNCSSSPSSYTSCPTGQMLTHLNVHSLASPPTSEIKWPVY